MLIQKTATSERIHHSQLNIATWWSVTNTMYLRRSIGLRSTRESWSWRPSSIAWWFTMSIRCSCFTRKSRSFSSAFVRLTWYIMSSHAILISRRPSQCFVTLSGFWK